MIKISPGKSKTALVTGGVRRLGKKISFHLAKSGYNLIVNYNSTKKSEVDKFLKEINKLGVKVIAVKADISNENEVKMMFRKVMKEFGNLDLLINNASVFASVDFFDINEKIIDNFLGINIKGTLFCSKEAAKIMQTSKNKFCRIINIASLGAFLNWSASIPYSVSKAGVVKLTKLMANRLAPKILVNAIAPGTINIDNDQNPDSKELIKYPMKRFASDEDIISIIDYLTTYNTYITGQVFIVDGGRTLIN
jgi:3-oxoacyl-[acyl-carrier protein] reductase